MMRVIPELLATLGRFFPPWMLIALGVVLAPIALVSWLRWLRAKQIRGALRTVFRSAEPTRREVAIERAFHLAGNRESALIALADTAHQTGLVDVTQRALLLLESLDLGKSEVLRIRATTAKPTRRASHPVEEAVVVERFIEQEMWGAARIRLDEALARFPNDPELLQLEEALLGDSLDKARG